MSKPKFKTSDANNLMLNLSILEDCQKMITSSIKSKYGSVLNIISTIGSICGKKVSCLTDFRNIDKNSIIEFKNIGKIVKYLNSVQDIIVDELKIDYKLIKMLNTDEYENIEKREKIYKKIEHLIRKLVKSVQYKFIIRNEKLSIQLRM